MADGRQTARRVAENGEVRRARRSHRRWPNVLIDLIIDQTPLLEKGVDSHDRADVSGQISSAGGDRQILIRIQTIRVDHEVSIGHVTETNERRDNSRKSEFLTFLASSNDFSR